MSPVGIFPKEAANPDLRTIAYETYKNEKIFIVKHAPKIQTRQSSQIFLYQTEGQLSQLPR